MVANRCAVNVERDASPGGATVGLRKPAGILPASSTFDVSRYLSSTVRGSKFPFRLIKCTEALGVSLRTLQTATQSVCGSGIHRYSRLKRLWSVRRQLRTGATGLMVKASALAHGFWHMSEFSNAHRTAFPELPSSTLAQARLGSGAPRLVWNSQ